MITIYILVFIFSVFSLINKPDFAEFTRNKTDVLKAILPFFIITHHTHVFDNDFYYVGAFVVSIFFFISGYGLETKRIKRGFNYSDLWPSVRKLIVPILIPATLYLLCLVFIENATCQKIIAEIAKYQTILPYTWYVLTLIILYIVFITLSSYCKLRSTLFIALIVISILSFSILGKYIGIPSWARNTTTALCAGILFQHYEGNFLSVANKKKCLSCFFLSIIFLFLTLLANGFLLGSINNPLKRPLLAFVWSLGFMHIFSVCKSINNNVVKFLSGISYELYICQSIAFILIKKLSLDQDGVMIYIISVFIIDILIAWTCNRISNKLVKR